MLISVAPPLQLLLLLATIRTAVGFIVKFEAKYHKDLPVEKHRMECTLDENPHPIVGGQANILFATIILSTNSTDPLHPWRRLAFKMPKNGFEELLQKEYDAYEYLRDKKPLLFGRGIAQVHFKGKADCNIREKIQTFDCIALEEFPVAAADHFYQLWKQRGENLAEFYRQVCLVLKQVLETIQEYSSIPGGFVHGDIKPEHIMLADSAGNAGYNRAALIDLSVAHYAGHERKGPARWSEPYDHPSLFREGVQSSQRTELFSFATSMISICTGGQLPWYDPANKTYNSVWEQRWMKLGTRCDVKGFITKHVPAPKLAEMLWTLYETSFKPNEEICYADLLKININDDEYLTQFYGNYGQMEVDNKITAH